MASFKIPDLIAYSSPETRIKRLEEISYFSYDGDRNFRPDTSSLRYYYPPEIGSSLSEGFENFETPSEQDEHLDGLLKSIMLQEQAKSNYIESDFITWRGMMTKIMTAPYTQGDGFQMRATRFQKTIFIEEDYQDRLQRQRQQYSIPTRPGKASQEKMAFWGHKFETLSLLPNTWDASSREFIENRTVHTVNNFAQFCLVAQTAVGGFNIVLGGEVDAVWDIKQERSDRPTNWVELKTSVKPNNSPFAELTFEKKLLKTWAQCYMLGVPKVIFGYRSNDSRGKLLGLQEFETSKIPKIVQIQGRQSWDKNVCINFTAHFLEFLKMYIVDDGLWIIRRSPESDSIHVFKETGGGYKDILSQEFIEWRSRREPIGDLRTLDDL